MTATFSTPAFLTGLPDKREPTVRISPGPEPAAVTRTTYAFTEEAIPAPGELNVRTAADRLMVSSAFLMRLLDEGKIPFRTDTAGGARIKPDDLRSYMKRRRTEQDAMLAELDAEADD